MMISLSNALLLLSSRGRPSAPEVVRVLTPLCAHLSSPKGPDSAPWGSAPVAKAGTKEAARDNLREAMIVAAKPESPGVTPAPVHPDRGHKI